MLHPALRQLLQLQAKGKRRRFWRAFATRRRFLWSLLAVVLAVIWFSNVVMSVLWRKPAAPEDFARLIPIGLLVYALWHVTKTVFKRPEDAMEWTEAERELLCAGPFQRHELIFYRLAGILRATLAKAACFTLLMLPDLQHPLAGFVGMLLSLVFLDLLRLNIETIVHGMSASGYRRFQAAAGTVAGGVVLSTLIIAFSQPSRWQADSTHLTWDLLRHVCHSAGELLGTGPGRLALIPFIGFANVIVAPRINLAWLGHAIGCLLWVGGLAGCLLWLDAWFARRLSERERCEYPPRGIAKGAGSGSLTGPAGHRVAWLAGAGPIAWRQRIGAGRQRSQLAVALALPGALALLPVAICRDGRQAALQVSGALIFYSFLLLPTALKFDFRRDIRRIAVLKTLPIHPLSLVVGQVSTPALLASVLQAAVLLTTLLVRPYPPWFLVAALLLMLPLNALIFALDNLIYLLYPYRLNQEGIEIFLRTTLTFTAKAVIFALGLLLTLGWAFLAHQIASWLPGELLRPAGVFVLGGAALLWGTTLLVLHLLAQVYVRFDPSQDIPA